MTKIIISLTIVLAGLFAFAHGDGRVEIEAEGTGQFKAGQFEYIFQLFDAKAKKALSDQDLNESHTKKLHFIAYDAALKEFSHVHPLYDGQNWKVDLNLLVDGKYFFWAQGELLDKTEFSAFVNSYITDGQKENQISALGNVRTGVDQKTKIALSNAKIKAGKMAMLDFTVSRTDGLTPVLSPYLGAFAHVIATLAGGDDLEHVHPIAEVKPNTGVLHATFPTEGNYRLWVQLNDNGELKTIPLSVTVLK